MPLGDYALQRGAPERLFMKCGAVVPNLLSRHLDAIVMDIDLHSNTLVLEYDIDDDDDFSEVFYPLRVEISQSKVGTTSVKVGCSKKEIPRKDLDGLRAELRGIFSGDLATASWRSMAFGVAVLQASEAAIYAIYGEDIPEVFDETELEEMEAQLDKQAAEAKEQEYNKQEGWTASKVSSWTEVLDNPIGLDLSAIKDDGKHLLGGRSVKDICKQLPDGIRILNIESVFRKDLVAKFLSRQANLKASLLAQGYQALRDSVTKHELRPGSSKDTLEGLAEFLVKPRATFHGAPRAVISSIVRHGFVIPGEDIGDSGKQNSIRCGASFGVGIYSSPDPVFASEYTPYGKGKGLTADQIGGTRLIICAVVMGRKLEVTRQQTRRTKGVHDINADSHISPDGMEYVVFDKAQIIPVYVLHCDRGADKARREFDVLRHQERAKMPSVTAQHRVAILPEGKSSAWAKAKSINEQHKAVAMKYLPFGFGPATGTSFVVEEIGEVSDDEDSAAGPSVHQQAGSWFDEYQAVRKA